MMNFLPFRPAAMTALAAGAVLLTSASLSAVERATFILVNGERASGTVIFHTDQRTNIRADTRQFGLGTNDGKEIYFHFDQVAVIEFVAGRPSQQELENLRPNSHMIVMRDGNMRRGLLIDLIGGDTVRWQNEGGERQDLPIVQVRRVFMATDAARSIYDYTPSNSGQPSSTSGSASRIPDGPGIAVPANARWTDTNLTVLTGETIRFEATGTVSFGGDGKNEVSPAGDTGFKRADFPVSGGPGGALIGRINQGTPFLIGDSGEVRMPARGRLQLSVNDSVMTDNTGGFRVVITRNR